MQSTGHSSMQALSFRSTQGCAMVYVTSRSSSVRVRLVSPPPGRLPTPGVPVSRPFVGIGVPMVVRFGPADVGRRVTLRRRLLDAEPGEPALGDVVGVLESWSAGVLTLRKRSGE